MYRIEIWIHPDIMKDEAKKNDELGNLKKYLRENFGSEIEDRAIEVKK